MAESPLVRVPFALATLTAVAFVRVPFGSFHFDDYLLLQDPSIVTASGFGGVSHLATTRPLTWFSYWLNYQLSSTKPFSWHLIDLLLHVGCVLLLYSCLRRLTSPPVSLAAALLFALHPIQVEPVAWVFARGTLLCTLFCLFALRAWLSPKPWHAVFFFALALTAKEEAVFFPFFLAIVAPHSKRAIAAMLALSAAAGARVLLATKLIAGSGAGFSSAVSASEYFVSQGAVIWRYFRLILFPYGLNFDPDLHPSALSGVIGWVAIVLLAAGCVKYRERWPAALWFLGGMALLLASSSVFPADDLAADRRLYLPMIAFAPVVALLCARFPKPAAIALAAALAILTFARTSVWNSERALWTDTVRRSPNKVRPRIQLARALPSAEALRQLEAAAAIHPNNAWVSAEKGRIHLQTNRPDLAVADFGQAAAAEPANPNLWNSLGGAFTLLNQQPAARRAFERALRIDPCHLDARDNLGLKPCGRPALR